MSKSKDSAWMVYFRVFETEKGSGAFCFQVQCNKDCMTSPAEYATFEKAERAGSRIVRRIKRGEVYSIAKSQRKFARVENIDCRIV